MQKLIVPLGGEPWPAEAVGGKADALHRMMRSGFPVPPGFCVTTHAFESVVRECAARASSLADLRSELREIPLPGELKGEIREQVREIGASSWAVRSSAVEEDDDRWSFAGQQRTELGVEGLEELFDAIRRVWAGLYDLEGLLYRTRLRVDANPKPMAVVVQAMVETSAAGVAFSESPVRPAGDDADGEETLWITASEEGPEAVVQGQAGRHYRVDRTSGAVREGPADGPLDSARLEQVVETVERLERDAGTPVDVEWAFGRIRGPNKNSAEQLYVLQSRPVTGRRREDEAESVWSNVNVGEALPGVATPLTWSIIGKFSRKGFERAFGTLGLSVPEEYELVGSFRGRVYLNLTQFVSVASGIPILEPEILFQMAGGGGLDLVEDAVRDGSPTEFLLRLPVTVARILFAQLTMPIIAPIWSRYFEFRLASFFDRDLGSYPRSGLAAEFRRVDRLFDRTGLLMLTCSSNFLMSYVVMKKSLDWFGDSSATDREQELFEALEVQSAEPVLDLLELARRARDEEKVEEIIEKSPAEEVLSSLEARADDEEVSEFLEAFDAFRAEHGHRAPREAELSTPRWREESSFVFEVLQEYLDREELPGAEQYRREWKRVRERIDGIVDEVFEGPFGVLFRGVLSWARQTEFMRTHVVETLDLYREFALECGRRLVEQGALERTDDVFYLRYEELRSWLEEEDSSAETIREFPLRVTVRRGLVEALRELPDPPGTFVLSDNEMISDDEYRRRDEVRRDAGSSGRARDMLHGLPGSRGRVTGPARVIRDLESEASIEHGEILVAPYADVGWTPLFVTASAVVMGLGGPLSHACIVAREFGIPTVVNAGDVTEVIETGDRITVDGDEGVVIVHGGDSDRKSRNGESESGDAASSE